MRIAYAAQVSSSREIMLTEIVVRLRDRGERYLVLAGIAWEGATPQLLPQQLAMARVRRGGRVGCITDAFSLEALPRAIWRGCASASPAHFPGWLIMRVLAYRIQTAAFGDLDRAMLRRLRESGDGAFEPGSARPFATRGPTTREGVGLKSGALLVREWNRFFGLKAVRNGISNRKRNGARVCGPADACGRNALLRAAP